ncbi:MAG TPA: phage tail protein [Solimonas sp.]
MTAGDDATVQIVQYAAAVVEPWSRGGADPRACGNDHEYSVNGGTVWYSSLDQALDILEENIGYALDRTLIGWSLYHQNSSDSSAEYLGYVHPFIQQDPGERESLYLHFNIRPLTRLFFGRLGEYGPLQPCQAISSIDGADVNTGGYWWSGVYESDLLPHEPPREGGSTGCGVWMVRRRCGGELSPPLAIGECYANVCGEVGFQSCGPGFVNYAAVTMFNDQLVQVRRKPRMPAPPCQPRCGKAYPLLPENPNYCAIGSRVEHTVGFSVASGSYKALSNLRVSDSEVTDYPLGPLIVAGSPDDTPEFWLAAYEDAVSSGAHIRSGLVNGVDYPVIPTVAYTRSYDQYALQPDPPTVGSVVRAICERVEVPADRIDVSDLTETLRGYSLSTLMTARQAIEPLQAYRFFDCVESDALLKFPKRGKPIVLTLSSADLGARFSGETAPPIVSTHIQQAVELPRLVRVHYKLGAKDYQPGMQQSPPRMTTDSVNAKDVQLAINMSDDKAAQIAQVIHQDDWWGRETYKTSASPALLALECSDCVGLPVEGQIERARIVNVSMSPPFGPLKWSLRRDDDGTYVSHATGATPAPSSDHLGVTGPTNLLLIDGPALDAGANDAGIYAAVWGSFSRWSGAQVMSSIDDGVSYKDLVTILTPATVGRIVDVLAAGPSANVWDYASELIVDMEQGVLASATEDAVLNGANPVFVGADQRWEVLQFMDALLLGEFAGRKRYKVTALLRGRRGTEWAQPLHQGGDWFVAVGPGMARISRESSDLGRTVKWKAVTLDMMEETAEAQDHLMQGVALKPYSPVHVTARRSGSGAITLACIRRTRLSGEWLDYVDVPLNEASEAYDWVITAAGGASRTLTSAEPLVTYTPEMQLEDFGNYATSLEVSVYQMSASVGRGYAGYFSGSVDESSAQPILRTSTVEFSGVFSDQDVFYVQIDHGLQSYTLTVSAAGKSSLDDLAADLALQADAITGLVAESLGPVVTITSVNSLSVYSSNNTLIRESVALQQAPWPIVSAGGFPFAIWDLYEKVDNFWQLSPVVDPRFSTGGNTSVKVLVVGRTYADRKAIGLTPDGFGTAAITITAYKPPTSGNVSYQTALLDLQQAVRTHPQLAAFGFSGSSTEGHPRAAGFGIQGIGGYAIASANFDIQALSAYHPSGFTPLCTVGGLDSVHFPSGAKQLSSVTFYRQGLNVIKEDMLFTVTLDGTDYTYTATSADEAGDDLAAVYAGLETLIEASGDFEVSFYADMGWLEIERDVIDTPFSISARVSYGAYIVITGST